MSGFSWLKMAKDTVLEGVFGKFGDASTPPNH